VHQHIVNLPGCRLGQKGTITSVRKDVVYVTLDALSAPLPVTTVLTAAATLLGVYTGPQPVLPLQPIQHAKVNLNVEQQSSVRGICETHMWRVHEIAPSATSTQLVVLALPADAPARRGGNLSSSCTQFPLATVIQLLKEAGVPVDLPADISASASGKPSEAAAPNADNLDLVNMPATFDYEGDETSWQQGLPPGEVGPQLSDLELSDSGSSVDSILGVCLDGFDGDA